MKCPTEQRVELSVLVEPLDTGSVELPGSVIITTGGATPVCKDDQINVIGRPREGYRFDHWEVDLSGPRSTQVIVMTQPKFIRAIFTKVETATQEPVSYHSIAINGQTVQSGTMGLENGSVTISPPPPGGGQSPYPASFVVTLTPRADNGFKTLSWSGDCGGAGPCQLTMTSDKDVQISFAAINHELTTSANPAEGGSVSPPGTSVHPHMTSIVLVPEANEGFQFVRWSGDCDGGSGGTCPLVMDGAKSATAIFAAIQHTLTVTAEPSFGGTVSPSGANSYEYGTQVMVEVASPAEGYEFAGWTGACSGTGNCELVMRQDMNVTAVFTLAQRTLATHVTPTEGGSVSPSGSNTFGHGESVTIIPKPATGHRFMNWAGDCSGSGSCTLIMDRDRSVAAVFAPLQFTLRTNASPTNGGSLSPQGPRTYARGTEVVITPVPAPGYKFLRWSGDCSGVNASCTVNMTQDRSVTAEFGRVQHTLTSGVAPSGAGTVSPSGNNGYQHGERVTINAQPSAGYAFERWEGDCSGTGQCTVIMDGNKSVTAVFTAIEPAPDPAYSQWKRFVKPGVVENPNTYVPRISDFGDFDSYVDDGSFLIRGGRIFTNSVVGFRTWLYHEGSASYQVGILGDDGVALYSNGTFIAGRGNAEDPANYGTLQLNSGWNKIEALVHNGPWSISLKLEPMLSTIGVIDANAYAGAPVPARVTLTTTANPAEGGTVSPAGTNTYQHGASVTVIPTPAAGYRFQRWEGACSGTGECVVVMDGNKSVTAVFTSADTISLLGGVINDQPLSVDVPTVSITSGGAISGTVSISVMNAHRSHAIFPVGATPSWGSHESSYWTIDSWATAMATTQYDVPIDLTAPTSLGTYAIIFAAAAETSLAHVMSATHWPSGSPRWNNGDDIALWDTSQIEFSIANGYVNAPMYGIRRGRCGSRSGSERLRSLLS